VRGKKKSDYEKRKALIGLCKKASEVGEGACKGLAGGEGLGEILWGARREKLEEYCIGLTDASRRSLSQRSREEATFEGRPRGLVSYGVTAAKVASG